MRIPWIIWLPIAMCNLSFAGGTNTSSIDFVHQYFKGKGVPQVTSALCWDIGNLHLLHKKFSESGIRMNNLDPLHFERDVLLSQLTSKYFKLGVILDSKCGGTSEILRTAHENDLFVQTKSQTAWLLLLEGYISEESLLSRADSYQPEVTDLVQYLTEPYSDTNNSDLLTSINRRVNAEFMEEYKRVGKPKPSKHLSNNSSFDGVLRLNLLLDNEMLLAVPGITELYSLYGVYKVTKESKMKISKYGTVHVDGERVVVRGGVIPARKSLEGAVLRGVTAIYSPKKFTSLDDLSTRDIDAWTKMSFVITQLLKDDLNFSLVIRFFDDYGWMRNNSFNALVGHLQRHKADLSAACLLFRQDRYGVVDYLDSPFRLQTGILFREPSLSSVTNIFLLPFSPALWIATSVLILLMVVAIECEHIAGWRCKWHETKFSLVDTVFFVLAAVGQQGHFSSLTSTSGRLIFFLLLFVCLALFTAFSAKIVAVMQSFSTSILSIKDITESNFKVGVQPNFPLFDVAVKESLSSHKVVREFYIKKILGQRGTTYFAPSDGIEEIRRGLFAYEVDLTVGYKLISDTYEEIDKCGLKEIEAFPKPYLGAALAKHSPFRESFVQSLVWQANVGLKDRAWRLWIPQKPKCEAERIGFISVGLTESYSAIMLFLYGFAASVSIFFMELIHYRLMKRNRGSWISIVLQRFLPPARAN